MENKASRRRLSNMRLTWKHHFPYMGMWVLFSVCLLTIVNVVGYLHIQERWAETAALGEGLISDPSPAMDKYLFLGMGIEVLAFSVAIVFLAMVTAHRIAGPYVKLRMACAAVAAGNLQYVLRFRSYDRLEELEEAFNAMVKTFRQEREGQIGK